MFSEGNLRQFFSFPPSWVEFSMGMTEDWPYGNKNSRILIIKLILFPCHCELFPIECSLMIYPEVSRVVSTSGSVFPWPVSLTDGTEMGIAGHSRDKKRDTQIRKRWFFFFCYYRSKLLGKIRNETSSIFCVYSEWNRNCIWDLGYV